MTRRRVSQQRIARDLGVSQALVSLALNGRKDGINADTYRRVWEHAVRLGYQPRGMRLERSPAETRLRQVGFILRAGASIHTQGSYFGHVLHGLHTALAAEGHAAVYLGAEDTLGADQLAGHFHSGHALRGVVLLGEVSPAFLQRLRGLERRIVAVSSRHPGLCHSVVGNEPQALAALVTHLRGLGHTRIGWLGGNRGLGRHEARHHAFLAALKENGLPADRRWQVFLDEGDKLAGAQAAEQLLATPRRGGFPTAFIAYNTHMAAGALRALARAGLGVPGTVSVAAADNLPAAREENPSLTVAGTAPEKLGAAAARLLLGSTGEEDESYCDLTLPAPLVPGGSTGPAPAARPSGRAS